MSRLLAIDTATEACSAALLLDGEILERYELAPREHSRLILPMVEALLDEAGTTLDTLDAVAFGRGPGSFTGLRIATGVAQGIAFGAGLPVVPISTLAALAQGAIAEAGGASIAAAIDARMKEVYWGAFSPGDDGLVVPLFAESVLPPSAVSLPDGRWLGTGSGWTSYREELFAVLGDGIAVVGDPRFPRARDIARLAEPALVAGDVVPPAGARPVYLRDQVARKPASG